MRRYLLFFIAIYTLAVTAASFAQLGIRKGIKAGYISASVKDKSTEVDIKSNKNLSYGVSLEASLLNLLHVQADVLYAPKGGRYENKSEHMDLDMKYLSIPIVLKKKFLPLTTHPYVLAGLEYDILLSAKLDKEDIKDELKSKDQNLVLGAGLELSLLTFSGYIEGRYAYGLSDIKKEGDSLKNKAFQVYVGILF